MLRALQLLPYVLLTATITPPLASTRRSIRGLVAACADTAVIHIKNMAPMHADLIKFLLSFS
jgi:hypothetical protein